MQNSTARAIGCCDEAYALPPPARSDSASSRRIVSGRNWWSMRKMFCRVRRSTKAKKPTNAPAKTMTLSRIIVTSSVESI